MLIQYRYNAPNGFVVSLASLRQALEAISQPAKRWAIFQVALEGKHPRVLVGHRNDMMADLVTDISFIFPVVEIRSQREQDVIVCLHPETMESHRIGLYIQEKGFQPDCMADFETFWPPLQEALEALDG